MDMTQSVEKLLIHLRTRLDDLRHTLGGDLLVPTDANSHFADLLDSMGLVEFIAQLAEDCAVKTEVIEACVGRRFTTLVELARRLHAAGIEPGESTAQSAQRHAAAESTSLASPQGTWLAATAIRLPERLQSAGAINEALHRPPGWLEQHAGIQQRRLWAKQDPILAAARACQDCLERAGIPPEAVGALLVTSEAPPLTLGLAAAMHDRLGLNRSAPSFEIGGACTGFLAALWTAQKLVTQIRAVLIVALEAPTRYLPLQPGRAGENAALFGDASAAALITDASLGSDPFLLREVVVEADGAAGGLLRIQPGPGSTVELHMKRVALASRALEVMAGSVCLLSQRHNLKTKDLAAVVAHGGNGRMAGLLARKLGLPRECIWSETANTGNLGSASLPAAWALHESRPRGPVIWTAVGAGLTWGAALFDIGIGQRFSETSSAASEEASTA
jgi:3-oxoacyl-[acyl-carrier-protein] synthase-3